MDRRSPHPVKDVALIALAGSDTWPGDMLEEVIKYAFQQLCWIRSYPDLLALLTELSAELSEEAA